MKTMKMAFAFLLLFSLAAALSAANATANWGAGCAITIGRSISSSSWLTTVTTVLANSGSGGCSLKDVVFEDEIPPSLGALQGMSFSPAVNETLNRTVKFRFAAFSAGEKKTFTYRSPLGAPASALDEFGTGILHPAGADAGSAALRPAYNQGENSGGIYNGTVVLTAIGVFIALAGCAAVIYYLEKKKHGKKGQD